MTKTFLFPGQGSQKVGMGADFCETFNGARKRFDEANEILGRDLKEICFSGPAEELTATIGAWTGRGDRAAIPHSGGRSRPTLHIPGTLKPEPPTSAARLIRAIRGQNQSPANHADRRGWPAREATALCLRPLRAFASFDPFSKELHASQNPPAFSLLLDSGDGET